MGSVIPFRRLGMLATSPSVARRHAFMIYRHRMLAEQLVGAHFRYWQSIGNAWLRFMFGVR